MWSYSEGRNQDFGFDEARLTIASEDNRYELSVSCMNNAEQNVTIILHTPERSDGVEGFGQGESFALSIDGHEAQELHLRSFNSDRFIMYGNMFRYGEAQYESIEKILESADSISMKSGAGLIAFFLIDFFNVDLGRFKRVCRIAT